MQHLLFGIEKLFLLGLRFNKETRQIYQVCLDKSPLYPEKRLILFIANSVPLLKISFWLRNKHKYHFWSGRPLNRTFERRDGSSMPCGSGDLALLNYWCAINHPGRENQEPVTMWILSIQFNPPELHAGPRNTYLHAYARSVFIGHDYTCWLLMQRGLSSPPDRSTFLQFRRLSESAWKLFLLQRLD